MGRPTRVRGGAEKPQHRRIVRHAHRLIHRLDRELDVRARMARGGVLEAGAHVRALGVQACDVVAARLTAETHLVGHDVDRASALDHAHVGGGLGVDAAETHGGDRFRRHTDRADAALRRHPGMRGSPVDHDVDAVRAGRPREDDARRVAVEDQPPPRADQIDVEVAGSEEPELLADGEDDVDGRMAHPVLARRAEALAHDRDARLVVAAEHGGPVAPDHVALVDRLHADARLDRVHVGAEEERRRVDGAGHVRDEVPDLAADRLVRAVELDPGAERVQLACEAFGDASFATRQAVDPHQVQEERLQPIGPDHGRTIDGQRS